MTSTTLPLDQEYALTPQDISNYERDGHILLRGVCSPEEVAQYGPLIRDAARRFNTESRPLAARDTYGRAFLQVMNLWERDEAVKRFTFARRFAQIAAGLMGVEGVRIYHDQALFKEPGGGPTPWHQDQHYWPLDTDKTITLWMPMVDVPAEVGSMTFGTGTHRVGYLGDMPISDDSERVITEFIQEKGYGTHCYGALSAGDATWHSGWTLHGAPGNPTPNVREIMTIIYIDAAARVIEPDSNSRRADLKRWLPGLQAGDIAASPLNPQVYP